MKKLPIGIQTFAKIIQGDFVYVDKTPIALELIENGSYYFLARPRRFGKSLFVDTLREVFRGNRSLFEGLYIYDKWDFNTKYPVIDINFATGFQGELSTLNRRLRFILKSVERDLDLQINNQDAIECFQELIWQINDKYSQKVVILVDEYDKLILDNLTDKPKARAIRDRMKEFYSVIKQNDDLIRFVFITGVSKFSKMNLFSGLNNLNDITLSADFGNICGYTQRDLTSYFSDHLRDVDLEAVKRWYNGYNYFGNKVYNPFDILLFISNNKEFQNYWWNTGNPSFLIDLLKIKSYFIPEVENYRASEELLSSFDIDVIELEALLWQTGYLTISQKIKSPFGYEYQLSVPNKEIQVSLNRLFAKHLTGEQPTKFNWKLVKALQNANTGELKTIFISLFASIAHNNYTNNNIANYEGYYASVIYAYLASLGFTIIPEDITNKGRIDLTLQLPDKTYIFEFKVVDKASNNALQQIKNKKYYQKYQSDKPIYLIGIEFGQEERNIINWETEKI